MPKVSILLPCYNAAATLPETIASIQAQTCEDYEVNAVDDGSTDGTRALLEAWAAEDRRVRTMGTAHGGVIAAANAGLAGCRGEYVARMDADDRMHPDRLGKQAAYLNVHPETGVVSCLVEPAGRVRQGFRIYLDWLNSLTTDEAIRREMFVESPIANPSAMVRRSLLEEHGGYEERGWPEDYDLWLRLYLAGVGFAKVPEVLLYWRDHPSRLTRTDSRYSLENFIRAKAHYLGRGPLRERDAVVVWGAGMHGRRTSKHLMREGINVTAFVDIDPKKIGRRRRGRPVIPPEELMDWWRRYQRPAVLAAVGARGARQLIRERLNVFGLVEGEDWWGAA